MSTFPHKYSEISYSSRRPGRLFPPGYAITTALIAILSVFCLPTLAQAGQESGPGQAASLEAFLDGDGHLSLPEGFSGSLDPTGFELLTAEDGRPRFVPQQADNVVAGEWEAFGGVENGCNSAVASMAYTGNGQLYIGGQFTLCGDVVANNVVRLDPDTGEFHALGEGADTGVNNRVVALAVDGDDLYVGGWFTQAGGQPANYVARWDGSGWHSLGDGAENGLGGGVHAFAVAGEELYVGGGFTQAGGQPANRVARWDGSAWQALGDGAENGLDDSVHALAVAGDELNAGGAFTQAGGQPANHVARWDGSSWASLGSGGQNGVNVAVEAMAVSDNRVHVGGDFSTAGGQVSSRIATFVIQQATATIEFADLVQTYTGDPLEPTITTDPPGLSVTVTYDGEPDVPTDAGSYAVVATIDDPNYAGSASETFEIERAQVGIEFADLVQVFTGNPLTPTITTDPEGLVILVTYNEQPDPPTEIGIYLVEVLVDEDNYTGWNSALFHIVGDQMFRDRFEEQPLQAGDTFSDCPDCPTMVLIPGGTFTQGSPNSEPQSQPSERPQRQVTVPAFALGQTEVTFDQWDACVADGGCTHNPGDQGWGRGNRPVINVSWHDAQEYVTWLGNKTGHIYRLPSESEWEYATRAGTTGRFNTGDCITTEQANFDGRTAATGCPEGSYLGQTLPVASFDPNAFGLFDTHGNTGAWTQDCWNWNYSGAPTDGSAWMTGNCTEATLRSSVWFQWGNSVRSAARGPGGRDIRTSGVSIRVARSVEP
jgi:formylglycine-generating enzyme required for sulfatase activity